MPDGWVYIKPNLAHQNGYYRHTSGDTIEVDAITKNITLWDHFTEESQNLLDTDVYEAIKKYNKGLYT